MFSLVNTEPESYRRPIPTLPSRGALARRLGRFCLLGALLAALAAPAGNAAADPLARARSLEKNGRLNAALRAVRTKPPKSEAGEHAANLRLAIRALEASSVYAGLEEYGRAEQILRAVLPKLDPVRDVFLAAAIHRRLRAIGRRKRTVVDAEAKQILKKGRALERAEKHEEAAATFKVLADRSSADVSEALIRQAKLGQLRSEAVAAVTEDRGLGRELWDSVKGGVETAARWLVYAGLVLFAIGALVLFRTQVLWRLPPRKRTALALEDLSAPPKERNAKNQALTRELMTAIKSLGTGPQEPGTTEIDETPDLDGTLLVNLKVVGTGLEAFESTIHDETPVKLGPLSFSPRQVLYLGSAYLHRRSEHELTGSLATSGSRTLLAVELFGRSPNRPEKRWSAFADGDSARAKAMMNVATRIVLDLGGSQISTSWQSFREYRVAMDALARAAIVENRSAALQEARYAFQRALDHDPANLLARFNLGNVLRKLGDNEAAVEHFAFLERLATDPRRHTPATEKLLERHPEFRHVVRYNRAIALSKIDSWECHKKAVDELCGLISSLDGDGDLSTEERRRLRLLTCSAWTAALVFRLERWRREEQNDPRLDARRREVAELIEDVRDWVEDLPSAEPLLEWTAYVNARATVQNALGRAYYLLGRHDEAYEAFERALSMGPDLGDAQVNMASLLLRRKSRYRRWSARAEQHLKRALELSPRDEKARFLLGILYVDPAVARYEEAKKQFEQLDDSWACFHLAELYTREKNNEAAVAVLRRSLHLSPRPDFRSKLYLEYVLALHKDKAASAEQLQDAVRIGQKLVKVSSGPRKAAAKKLLAQVERAFKKVTA